MFDHKHETTAEREARAERQLEVNDLGFMGADELEGRDDPYEDMVRDIAEAREVKAEKKAAKDAVREA